MMDRCIEVHRKLPERFLDLRYEELIADPMGQVRRIYQFLAKELSVEAEHKMREWAVENSRDKRPIHHYTLEKFGFSEQSLQRDFANYQAFLQTL